MAQFVLENNSLMRKSYEIYGVSYLVDSGWGIIVDSVTQQIIQKYQISTQSTTQMTIINALSPQNISTNQIQINSDKIYLVAAARPGRGAITIINLMPVDVYIGGPNVSPGTGTTLLGIPGNNMTISTQSAIYAISSSGPVSLSILEAY